MSPVGRLATVAQTLVCAAYVTLAGCGYVGDPLPPALNIPDPVHDVSAVQLGPDIVLRFSLPERTTDDLPVERLQSVELTVNDAVFMVPPDATEFRVAAARFAGQEVALRLRAIGRTGRPSEWSDVLRLSVGAPFARPSNVAARNVAEGVALTWSGDAPSYRLTRAIADGEFAPLAETQAPSYIDNTTVYGTRYRYRVEGFNGPQQSLPSEIAEVTPEDVFPPAVPTGLAAVPGASTIELSWARNTEGDFAAYQVRRAVDEGPFQPIAKPVLPSLSDTAVQTGRRYRYTVSAIDERGNESAPSPAIDAALP